MMEQMNKIPIYRQTGAYAREHGELEQFRNSNVANIACRAAIEEAIRNNFDGMYLQKDVAKPVIQEFGAERVLFVLANTIQWKDWDGRFSNRNKAWAASYSIPADVVMGRDRRLEFVVQSHPAVLDGFIDLARKEARERERVSVHGKLQKRQEEHLPKQPTAHKKQMER